MEQESKKTMLIVIWCSAAVLLLGGALWGWFYLSQFSSYHDKQYNFTLKYPVKWEKMEKFQGTAVTLRRPKQTALDTFQPNVNITVQEVPGKIATLASFSEAIMKQMKAVFKTNVIVLEDKSCTFADRPAHLLVLAAPKPSNLKLRFVWTIKGSFAYIFTFIAQGNQYNELVPTIKGMVDSFELK
ncbi:MAG: hypothetical protein HQL15_10250 [Candidatus Omnitrophica bacterium]|nr:hypothetical protein [Candidatus Omnitrophota bacterium]